MRKALLSIAAVALLSSGVSAQIIFNDTSFSNPVGTTDSFAYIVSGYNTLPENTVTQTPSNFMWKLTTFSFQTKRRWIQHIAATGYDYANKTIDTLNHKTDTVTTITPIKMVYMPEFLTDTVHNSGIIEYGFKMPATGYSLSSLPLGMPTDSIKFPAQTVRYYSTTISNLLTSRNKLKFPASQLNLNVPWTSNYQDTVHGTMRYAIAGLMDTPIHIKTEVLETKTIVGYGKMKVNKPTYMIPALSDTMLVLQVRVSQQYKDYYYIGSTLADSTTLSFIGVKGQGTARLYYFDEYYRRDIVEPVLTIRMYDGSYNNAPANMSDLNLRHLNPTEVSAITNLSSINVYPNPVKGGIVNVDIDGTQDDWSYTVYNVQGQAIKTGTLNTSNGKNKVELPADLAAGSYFMSLENGTENVVKTLTIAE